eukprot:Tamp_12888.p1 GENE.Tamp_12888~~Tamp_12888.p1  ORF type:complete len:226 (+),score=21.36 Tamp_12888:807-1484(+)
MVQTPPKPRIAEVDEDGNEVPVAPVSFQPVSWRRIREQEGTWALWGGCNARIFHQALWRGSTLTLCEIMMYLPGNERPAFVIAKAAAALALVTVVSHPVDVACQRIAAGCVGYNKAGVYSGLMRALKDDTAYAGLRQGFMHSMLTSPVRFGFLSLPIGFAYMVALFPIDRRATLSKLVDAQKAEEALQKLPKRGFWARNYGGAGFQYYCATCLIGVYIRDILETY